MNTDEQLNERADELTTLFDMAGYVTFTTNPLRIYWNLTREALGREKESLRLLEEAHTIAVRDNNEAEDPSEYGEGLLRHIATLRKRLGLTT